MILFFSDGKGAASVSNNKMKFEQLLQFLPSFLVKGTSSLFCDAIQQSFLRHNQGLPKKTLLAILFIMANHPNISFLGTNLDFLDHPMALA